MFIKFGSTLFAGTAIIFSSCPLSSFVITTPIILTLIIELGYKGLHLDDTLQVFASVYHYDYDGYQDELEQFDPIRGAGANFVSNADGIPNTKTKIAIR